MWNREAQMVRCSKVAAYNKDKWSRSLWFSNTANVNRKTVDSSGIWTRTFENTCPSLYQLNYRVTGNGVLVLIQFKCMYKIFLWWLNAIREDSFQCSNPISEWSSETPREKISLFSNTANVDRKTVDVSSVRKSWNFLWRMILKEKFVVWINGYRPLYWLDK